MKHSVAKYIEWLKEKMCDSDKCPSDSTLKTYAYSLAWMADRIDGFTKDKVPDCETIMKYMNGNKVPHARRLASYTALKVWHNCNGDKDCSKKYCTPLILAKREQDSHYAKQKRSDHQNKNWVDFKVLKKYAACIRDKTFHLDKNKLWNKDEYAMATLAFILQFHLVYPIRRCLCTVQWGIEHSDDENYLDWDKQSIVWNKHKTHKYQGQIVHKLSRQMWRLFGLLRKQQKMREITSGHILLNRYWRKMTKNGFSSWIKREMKKCYGCADKEVGCLIIRHAVITHKRRHCMTNAQREKFALQCMHTPKTNDDYRVH